MENQEYVIEFTCKYQYAGAPEPAWWVLALVLTKVADQVNSVSQQLRTGKGFRRDRQQLVNLMNQLLMLSGAVGPIVPSDVFSISCEDVVIGSLSLSPMAVGTFLKAQGDFVNSAIDSLEPNDYQTLLDANGQAAAVNPGDCLVAIGNANIASTFVLTVLSKFNQIVSDNTSACKDSSSMIYQAPGFLPDALGKMRHQDFVGVMQQQRFRLAKFFSIEEIDMIETQHRAIRRGYLVDKNVRAELDNLGF